MTKHFKILGKGCEKCADLEQMVIQIVQELGVDAIVTHEGDEEKIKSYGVNKLPGLAIDEDLIISGYLPDKETLKDLLGKLIKR